MYYASFAFSLIALVLSVGAYVGYRTMWDRRDMERYSTSLEKLEQILNRMELATFVVAADLTTARDVVAHVAEDLAEAQKRADEVTEGEPGEAADAGAQSGTNGGEKV